MSKIKGELSYKDWCILKHALAEKVNMKEDILSDYNCIANKVMKSLMKLMLIH
jgi:deoxyadenosine/deoxycytidine kinase